MSARIGLLGRADSGGLGSMTAEFARHLHPNRTLVVDLGNSGRGRCHLERFTDHSPEVGIVTSWPQFDYGAADWLLRDIDVLYTAETYYWQEIQEMAFDRKIKTVLHSMPELHNVSLKADAIWVPTNWEIDRIPEAILMPVPVALDRFPIKESSQAKTFLHIAASAMLDRNGTDIVLQAISSIKSDVTIAFRGIDGSVNDQHSLANVKLLPSTIEYWDMTSGADVLIYPRRYAGLSLPMQEAMARGMPIISTDLSPQNQWPGVHVIPTHNPTPSDMKGGRFNVWSASPDSLANAIDELTNDDGLYKDLSDGARFHAESISWKTMTPKYIEAFDTLA